MTDDNGGPKKAKPSLSSQKSKGDEEVKSPDKESGPELSENYNSFAMTDDNGGPKKVKPGLSSRKSTKTEKRPSSIKNKNETFRGRSRSRSKSSDNDSKSPGSRASPASKSSKTSKASSRASQGSLYDRRSKSSDKLLSKKNSIGKGRSKSSDKLLADASGKLKGKSTGEPELSENYNSFSMTDDNGGKKKVKPGLSARKVKKDDKSAISENKGEKNKGSDYEYQTKNKVKKTSVPRVKGEKVEDEEAKKMRIAREKAKYLEQYRAAHAQGSLKLSERFLKKQDAKLKKLEENEHVTGDTSSDDDESTECSDVSDVDELSSDEASSSDDSDSDSDSSDDEDDDHFVAAELTIDLKFEDHCKDGELACLIFFVCLTI